MNCTSYDGGPFAIHIIFTPVPRRLIWYTELEKI
jgi:hypothetical protein